MDRRRRLDDHPRAVPPTERAWRPASPLDETRLSQLTTRWSLILQVCRGPNDTAQARQAEVLERYCGAIYRYALRCVGGDADLADEACQEFALRFVRGDFRHANPEKGRFRDYVKTSIVHLLAEFRRQTYARKKVLPLIAEVTAAQPTPEPVDQLEAEFQLFWQKELLNRAWREMEQRQSENGPPYYTTLRAKAERPTLSAAALAELIASAGKGVYSEAGIRQVLHRSREIFAGLLLDEVARSLLSDDLDLLETELADLDLLTYCREALAKRRA